MVALNSVSVFVSLFGKSPKVVNGKVMVRMSEATFAKFAEKWQEMGLANNYNQGFFYNNNCSLLQAWG